VSDSGLRAEVKAFFENALAGEFAHVRARGGSGDEHACFEERCAWERYLGANGWIGVGWPKAHGGRGFTIEEQVVFAEEYARAQGPGRVGHIGEQLVGPTIIAFGTDAQRERFLGPILRGEELWCQGYSEPGAGSDLAALSTRATLDGDEWVVNGQKVWTSLAQSAQWCFMLARTDPEAPKHRGISYLLVPMDQPGIEVRPIVQLTGTSEFNEVFFTDARTAHDNVVGAVNDGWKVAMGTLAFERGVSTLVQQMNFDNELQLIIDEARARDRLHDAACRQRIAGVWSRLRIMRWNTQRTLASATEATLPPAALISKLYWSSLHREMGELAMDVLGPAAAVVDGEFSALQRLFLFSRADTIYGGTNQIQRSIIGERALGLPREPQ